MSPMLTAVLLNLLSIQQPPAKTPAPGNGRLQVFLDCNDCFADYLREETPFVDFVRDRSQADVHVIITSVETGVAGVNMHWPSPGRGAGRAAIKR